VPGQTPESGQHGDQAASSLKGQPRFTWVPGSVGAGPVPLIGPVPASAIPPGGEVPGGGRARVPDWQALLEALAAGGFLDGRDEDQDELLADELAAEEDGRLGPVMPTGQVAALAVEHMDPGPAMAGWLGEAAQAAGSLDENCLVGMAIAARQLVSWAQATELAAVAQLTSRAAAADRRVGVGGDGRPARVCHDAVGQISLALTLTDYDTNDWADLAVTLTWRLPATGAALARGVIDLSRARVIAGATSVLSEKAARAVEAAILPGAGTLTAAQLRRRVRRAVIAADPDSAERRRQDAQRYARVSLYGDEDGTATLAGTGLPAVQAAAAMARITAIARAMKASGQAGGLDLHRAKVMLGLLLGTLPCIPPAEGTPPGPSDPGDSGPGDGAPGPGGPGDGAPGPGGPGGGPGSGGACPDAGLPDDLPAPRDEDAPPDDGLDDAGDIGPSGQYPDDEEDLFAPGPVPPWPGLGVIPPALARPAPAEPDGRPVPGLLDVTLPWATLAGLPGGGPGTLGRIGPVTPAQARQLARAALHGPAAQWRIIVTNPVGQAIAVARVRRRIRTGLARPGACPADSPSPPAGLVGRVTLTISQDSIRQHLAAVRPPAPGRPDRLTPVAAAALKVAARALDRALAQAQADAAAGGCAHTDESPAYRPPPRVREFVVARDVTCRFRTCGQPAWRADLDHTIPYDQGGRTCTCDLGGRCRKHHILKQHPRWKLEQNECGEFTWTTPAGRTYTSSPDIHPV
jgi:hypothetical protein